MNCPKDMYDYIDVFLDPIVAIVTFLLGYWLANITLNKKIKLRKRATNNYFNDYLIKQIKATQKFVNQISSIKNKLKSNLSFDIGSLEITTQPFSLFDSINKIELHEAWNENDKMNLKEFSEVILIIEFLKNTHDIFLLNHKALVNSIQLLGGAWNDEIVKFHSLKGVLLSKPVEVIEQDQALVFLNETYNKWISGDSSLKSTEDILIDPIDKYFSNLYRSNPESTEIIYLLTSVQTLKKILIQLRRVFSDYIEILNNNETDVTKEINKIQ